MDAILNDAATLNAALIAEDPEEYDNTAKELDRKLQKQTVAEAASLSVCLPVLNILGSCADRPAAIAEDRARLFDHPILPRTIFSDRSSMEAL